MRVLINGMVLGGKKTGIGHYTSELIRCLAPLLGPDGLSVHRATGVEAVRRWLVRLRPSGNGSVSTNMSVPSGAALRGWAVNTLRGLGRMASHLHFRHCARQGFALYHEPDCLPMECDLPTVTTVHDLSVMLYPEWHPADRVAEHQREFMRGLARSQHIITVSDHARGEIIRHLGLPADRVSRTYNGIRQGLGPMPADEIEVARREMNLPPNYLLHLGTIEPRKNLMLLLRAYCSLPGNVRQSYPLVLVGSWGWNSADVAEFLHDEARHLGVIYLGYVAESRMRVLYNAARALVFPSHYEGFGLPPIEMMACGGAVLASTAGAIQETVGRKAHLIPADDFDGWRAALLRVCTDDDWLRELRCDTQDVARVFSWEQCALETLEVYDHVVFGPSRRQAQAA